MHERFSDEVICLKKQLPEKGRFHRRSVPLKLPFPPLITDVASAVAFEGDVNQNKQWKRRPFTERLKDVEESAVPVYDRFDVAHALSHPSVPGAHRRYEMTLRSWHRSSLEVNKMYRFVSVVLPTLNEVDVISDLIESVFLHVPDLFEVIVADDDSPDGTWKVVKELSLADDRIKLIRTIGNRCLTFSIQKGIDAARGDVVVWMDADFSHPPEIIPVMLRKLDEGFDLVVASRYIEGGGDLRGERSRRFTSLVINRIASLVLGGSARDYTSGFIAVRREVLQKFRLNGDYGEYFIDFVYRASKGGFKVAEIPYFNVSRQKGETKTGESFFELVSRGRKYLSTIASLRLKLG